MIERAIMFAESRDQPGIATSEGFTGATATDFREASSMKEGIQLVGMVGIGLVVLSGSAAAGGPGGGGHGGGPGTMSGNAGGSVRGLERAEQVASPQGQRGIENAEQRINSKGNAKNPNARREQDADASSGKSRK